MLRICRKEKTPEQAPSAILLARARQALEGGQSAQARVNLGFGEILAGESGGSEGALVEYLLDAGSLWLEFGHWFEAYDRFLEAEYKAEGTIQYQAIQIALLGLETELALRYSHEKQVPHARFWTCLAARRADAPLVLPLEEGWLQVQETVDAVSDDQARALKAVEIFATARCLGLSVGSLEDVAAYVTRAPESLAVLREFRHFVRSLWKWQELHPVTKPWLQVLDAVAQGSSARPLFSMDGRTS